MSAPVSLIPELEGVIAHSPPERRAETLKRVAALFLDRAHRLNDDHIRLFDEVFSRLIEEIETKARIELSNGLAPIANAPARVVRSLANDDDIAVAGPILKQSSRLAESDLGDIAKTKSQAHLLAISERTRVEEPVTDVLVRRGDSEVVHSVVDNRGARLSSDGLVALVERAEKDGLLAEKIGRRPDIPPRVFRDLVLKATEVVQQRLLATAQPEMQAEIRRVLAKVSREVGGANAKPRDYSAAIQRITDLLQRGQLDESALLGFANNGRYEEMVVALASLCKVSVDIVDRLMSGERPDPILILCKSAGWGWVTAKAIITGRRAGVGASSVGLDAAYANFDRLSSTTAQRVMRFWQVQTQNGGPPSWKQSLQAS
jgi:uncharacterized protein (DUF2336 family)